MVVLHAQAWRSEIIEIAAKSGDILRVRKKFQPFVGRIRIVASIVSVSVSDRRSGIASGGKQHRGRGCIAGRTNLVCKQNCSAVKAGQIPKPESLNSGRPR